MQTLKRTYQEANEGLALYTVTCNFVTMVTTAYYVLCPLSLPSAFNNCIQQTRPFLYMVYHNGLYSECMKKYGGMSGLFWNTGAELSFLTALTCKVKVTLVQAPRLYTGRTAHRGSRGIALLFHDQR
jgi:hypothetical protein